MLKTILSGNEHNGLMVTEDMIRNFDMWVTNKSRKFFAPVYTNPLAQFSYALRSPTGLQYDKNLNNISPDNRIHSTFQVSILKVIFSSPRFIK